MSKEQRAVNERRVAISEADKFRFAQLLQTWQSTQHMLSGEAQLVLLSAIFESVGLAYPSASGLVKPA